MRLVVNKQFVGFVCLLGYGLITPLSSNIRQSYSHIMPLDVMVCLATFFASIIGYVLQVHNLKKYFCSTKVWLPTFLKYTILDTLAWLGFFLIPAYWGAYFASYTYFIFQLILGTIFIASINTKHRFIKLLVLLMIFCQFIFFYANFIFISKFNMLLSIIFVAVVGIATFRVKFYLVQLVRLGISEQFILANKWWLLFFVSLGLSSNNHHHIMLGNYVFPAFIVAITVMILPIYLAMKSVVYMSPTINAIVSGIIPLVTFFMQTYIFHQTFGMGFSISVIMAVMLAVTAIIAYYSMSSIHQNS